MEIKKTIIVSFFYYSSPVFPVREPASGNEIMAENWHMCISDVIPEGYYDFNDKAEIYKRIPEWKIYSTLVESGLLFISRKKSEESLWK